MIQKTSTQSFSINTRTAAIVNTLEQSSGMGISLPTSSSIRFANAGTYRITSRVIFQNASANNVIAVAWYVLDSVDVTNSTNYYVIQPAPVNRSTTILDLVITVTANQDLQVFFNLPNNSPTLTYSAAAVGPPAYPASCPLIINILRVA
jgi:hypothetical protein